MLLKGKTTIVTGSNRGIGKAILEVFANNGSNLWACIRKPDDMFSAYIKELAGKTGVSIAPIYFDLFDPEQVKTGVQSILATNQPVDVLVNNAGIIHTALFQMTSPDKLKELFEVNFFAQMRLTQYIVKIMTRQKRGSIINISSSAAIEGNKGRLAYAASKASMICATKVLAMELAEFNIRVNAIAPGLTMTDMMKNSTPDNVLASVLQRTCLKRVGEPEEIANAVLFLASDLSSFITGQAIRVDGGM